MSGTISGFDPDAFRTNILNTMIMGLPEDTALQPTFYFRSTATYPDGTNVDPTGKAIDPRVTVTLTATQAPVQVPCAVQFTQDNTNDEGLVGTFWTDRATVTVLDTQYALIEDAIEVDLSGRRYSIQQVVANGLGPVTVYTLQCYMKGTGGDA